MNKTNFAVNGGFPIVLDDFTFEQESIRDAFKGALSAFGNNFIISGCNWYGTYLTNYHEGYIFLNGEICKVDAGARPTLAPGEDPIWAIDISNDSAGDKILENSATVHAYQIRKAKVISAVYNPSIHIFADDGQVTFNDIIVSMAVNDTVGHIMANKILSVIATSGLYASGTLPWNAYSPTFTALNSSFAVVTGGVTVASFTAVWQITNNTLSLRISSIDISTLATVRYIAISLPTSSLLTGKGKIGTGACRFGKYATTGSGLPVVVNVDLNAGGSGDPLMMEKADKTDFGALSNYDFRFSMDIALV